MTVENWEKGQGQMALRRVTFTTVRVLDEAQWESYLGLLPSQAPMLENVVETLRQIDRQAHDGLSRGMLWEDREGRTWIEVEVLE